MGVRETFSFFWFSLKGINLDNNNNYYYYQELITIKFSENNF